MTTHGTVTVTTSIELAGDDLLADAVEYPVRADQLNAARTAVEDEAAPVHV